MASRHYVVQTTDPSIATTDVAVKEIGALEFPTTWLATLEQYTDRNRQTRTVRSSLFPGYVFVEFDVGDDRWMLIPSCRGVRKVLGSGPLRPTALPDGALGDLSRRFEAGEFKAKPEFGEGDRLNLIEGPFVGRVGVCKLSRGARVEVLLRLFGQDISLVLKPHMVRRMA